LGNRAIHLVSFRADLDERSETIVGARKSTPHSMVQEFLNRSDAHLWGIVSNGHRLRLLRDNSSLTRQAFVEFDLESMMQGEVYADFALLWLLLHQSRVEGERPSFAGWRSGPKRPVNRRTVPRPHAGRCGVCHRDPWTGFPGSSRQHRSAPTPADGQLPALDYYKQLLRVVYRFIFLFIAEDRDLLHAPVSDNATEAEKKAAAKAKEAYFRHYSVTRLRRMAQRVGGTQHVTCGKSSGWLWQSRGEGRLPRVGLPASAVFCGRLAPHRH